MPAQSTTKMQVQAYRFGMRRLETAVATGQSYRRTLGGPRPNLSFLVGFILAALAMAGFAVYALISPSPSIGDAKVLVDGDNGGAYVLRGKVLHPALNYSSALLAAGNSTDSSSGAAGTAMPKVSVVDSDTLSGLTKGQTLGIEGAPNVVPSSDKLVAGTWTVCDQSTTDPAKSPVQTPKVTTTVVLGRPTLPQANVGNSATLVSDDGSKNVFLLEEGLARRIADPTDDAVRTALNLTNTVVRPISPGLLTAIPHGPDLKTPTITDAGTPPTVSLGAGITVGTVFRAQYATRTDATFVSLKDGYEALSPVLSDLIRAKFDVNGPQIPYVALATLRASPQSKQLVLSDYPSVQPRFVDAATASFICLGWDGTANANAYSVYPTTESPLPNGATAVRTPASAHSGSSVDYVANAVYVAPGHGELIGQVTNPQQSPRNASLYLVTDEGVAYPVVSKTALSLLGVDINKAHGANPSLVQLLPTGPVLDPTTASQYYGAKNGN